MTDSKDDGGPLDDLARKYLDLWVEHWASSLAAPEAAGALARLFTTSTGNGFAGFDAFTRGFGAPHEPAPFRTAPNAGDGRIDELERRVAALERQLAQQQAGAPRPASGDEPAMARPARRPRRGPRTV